MSENKGNKPLMKIRNGQITATVWENLKTINDKDVLMQSVVLEKSYKIEADGNEEWKSTNNFSKADISKAIAVLQRVEQELNVQKYD